MPGGTRVVRVRTKSGKSLSVGIARTPSQGNLTANVSVQNLIEEHSPRLALAVGIAGAIPTSDIFLGDILLVNEVHDLTLGAETQSGREEAAASTHLTAGVKNFVANLTIDDFKEWEDFTASIERPSIDTRSKNWSDDEDWNSRISSVLSQKATRQKQGSSTE